MQKVNFIIQTALLVIGGVLGVISAFDFRFLIWLLLVQFVIGVLQFGGALCLFSTKSGKHLRNYILISTVYVISLFALQGLFSILPLAYVLYLTLPAWTLAIYYYRLTYRSMFIKSEKQSSFLPHINF